MPQPLQLSLFTEKLPPQPAPAPQPNPTRQPPYSDVIRGLSSCAMCLQLTSRFVFTARVGCVWSRCAPRPAPSHVTRFVIPEGVPWRVPASLRSRRRQRPSRGAFMARSCGSRSTEHPIHAPTAESRSLQQTLRCARQVAAGCAGRVAGQRQRNRHAGRIRPSARQGFRAGCAHRLRVVA